MAGGYQLSFPNQSADAPLVHLCFDRHSLQALRGLAQVEPVDLCIDAVELFLQEAMGKVRGGGRGWTEALEMYLETAAVEVGAGAVLAVVRALPTVEVFVELEMDKLGEAGRTQLAQVGPLPRVESLVGLEVAGAAETLVAHLKMERLKERLKRF